MRILHLTLSFQPGGRRKAIERLADGLRGLGVESDLACLDELGCDKGEIESLFGTIDVIGRAKPFRPRSIKKLAEICLSRRIDIIHAHDAGSQLAGAMLCGRAGAPALLMTFHRTLSFESTRLRDRLRNAYSTAKSSAVIVASTERQRHFIESNYVRKSKVVRIPLGVDVASYHADPQLRVEVRRELGIDEDSIVAAVIGHFGLEKGVDQAVAAFRLIRTKCTDFPLDLLVCGSGTETQLAYVRELAGVDSRVHFLGYRRDVPRILKGVDLLLHSPREEAYGLVVVEAMASGLPVIATRVGGMVDLVVDGQTGVLVPGGDVSAIAGAIEELASNCEMRREMGVAGRDRALHEYTVRLCAERHRSLYEDVLLRRVPRGLDAFAAGGANQSKP